MRDILLNQEIDVALNLIKDSLISFQKMDLKAQEKNQLVLKNNFLGLISIIKFFLLKIGFFLNLKIRPSDSISQKVEKINSFDEDLLKEYTNFLIKIMNWRNSLEHNDLKFPKINIIIKLVKDFEKFYQDIKSELSSLSYSNYLTNFLLIKAKNKIISLKTLVTPMHFESLLREIDLVNSLPSNNIEDVKRCREKLWSLARALDDIFPFSKNFSEIIIKCNLNLLKDPFKTIERFWLVISNDIECPVCGEQELTSNFWICKEYPSFKKKFCSIVPFIIKNKEANAFCSFETWENGMYCDCEHPEDCNRLKDNNNMPIGSKFCENCGFYYLPSIEIGIIEDFTAALGDLPSWN